MRIPPPPQWLMFALAAAVLLAFAIHQPRGENAPAIFWEANP